MPCCSWATAAAWVAVFVILNVYVIGREEAYLERRFGRAYAAYKHAKGEKNCVAARCGNTNERIDWSLDIDIESQAFMPDEYLPIYGSQMWDRLPRRVIKGGSWYYYSPNATVRARARNDARSLAGPAVPRAEYLAAAAPRPLAGRLDSTGLPAMT